MAPTSLLRISIFHSATHNQIGPLWCWFLSGWACARPRPLWVSPSTSPVRLGVSPTAAPTPMGVFNQRSQALCPRVVALGCEVCFAPCHLSGLSVYECGATGSASGQTACPVPQSTTSLGLPVAALPRVLSAQLPVSAPPTGLDE